MGGAVRRRPPTAAATLTHALRHTLPACAPPPKAASYQRGSASCRSAPGHRPPRVAKLLPSAGRLVLATRPLAHSPSTR